MARCFIGTIARSGVRWFGFIESSEMGRAVRVLTVLALIAASACSSETDWDRKDAWRRCDEAISDWPGTPAPPCEAMHICANEAPLSPDARGKLARMIAATPGCPAP